MGYFPLSDLKRCNLDQYENVEAALPIAALDNFEYQVEEIISHRPLKRSSTRGKKVPKKDFEFLVRWADLPEDESNPSWEPWSNTSLRTCAAFEKYCAKPEVVVQLGADFYVAETGDAEEQRKR